MWQLLKNYLWHLPKAILASAWYGFPARKLTVVGVTGTKGKTTTCHMIYHIMKAAGIRAGLISTIGGYFGDEEIDTGLHVTSPDPRELQKLLRMAVDRGLTHVVLEVTSSGLDQFRVWGIKFKAAVITNIYPDHLDYHGTMEKYVVAKAKIIKQSETVVLPKDFLYRFTRSPRLQAPGAPATGGQVDSPRRWRGSLETTDHSDSLLLSNKLLALKAIEVLGVPEVEAVKALKDFKGVKGRLEVVYQNKFLVVIDFAHTPESLQAALKEMRLTVKKGGRLIAVFGCAGERDHGRRRMGAVAAKSADFFVITAEDPRTEKVEEISEEIAGYSRSAGGREVSQTSREIKFAKLAKGSFSRIPDRQVAINYAISMAKSGDVIGLFGKGHEKSMCFGKKEIPWSEHEAVQKALRICVESLDT